MSQSCLVVFIDSLPFMYVDRMGFLSKVATIFEITPGVGYSVNLHPELFGGYQPDDVGFFGAWTYDPLGSDFARLSPYLPLLDWLASIPSADRAVRRVLKILGGPTMRVPVRYLDRFRRTSANVFASSFPLPTVLSQAGDLQMILPYGGLKGERDKEAYLEARTRMQTCSRLFVSFPDLDSLGHRHGVGSPEYDERVRMLDGWVQELAEMLLCRDPQARIVLLSDHGMVNVSHGYRLTIESDVGPAHRASYSYFLDSTLLRVWVHDDSLANVFDEYLQSLGIGQVLDLEARRRYGLRRREWGDVVFVVQEATVFLPSFVSATIPKAMHGYHPELPSQKAVLALIGGSPSPDPIPQKTVEVAAYLTDILL